MGYGDSLPEAEAMLRDCAKDLAHAMNDDSSSEYTEGGNRMCEFVLPFLSASTWCPALGASETQ